MLENPGAAVSIRTHESLRWIRCLVALAVLSASVLAQTRPAPSNEEFESFLHRGFQFHEPPPFPEQSNDRVVVGGLLRQRRFADATQALHENGDMRIGGDQGGDNLPDIVVPPETTVGKRDSGQR